MGKRRTHSYYELFAGGGMARLGLGSGWECLFANDICPKKGKTYRDNFRNSEELLVGDIKTVRPDMLAGDADLAWGSFPCQDLSAAGNNGGINASRSGLFWSFVDLFRDRQKLQNPVPLIVIENVVGLVTSRKGGDLSKVLSALVDMGYRVGPVIIDAVHFLPHSRPRLFLVCVKNDMAVPKRLTREMPSPIWHPKSLVASYNIMPAAVQRSWIWWDMPVPADRTKLFKNIFEENPVGVDWHTPAETKRLISMMSPTNSRKLKDVQKLGKFEVGTVYKRTRRDPSGNRVQRAEVRFDGLSGCLRTPTGGSSRQLVLTVEGKKVRSRLLSPREAARLMGVPESYKLPARYNDAYQVMGDGLAVPAVSWLERHILRPLANQKRAGIT